MHLLILTAHDDDMLIAVGGTLLQWFSGAHITQHIATSCERSHEAVYGEQNNPTRSQIRSTRREENKACNELLAEAGLTIEIIQWEYPEITVFANIDQDWLADEYRQLIEASEADTIIFHERDGHPDHRHVHDAVAQALSTMDFTGRVYTTPIWTKEVAANNPEIDEKDTPSLQVDSEIKDVSRVIETKRRALMRFKSQVETDPYPDRWKPQPRAILDESFITHALRGEEILTPWSKN